MTKNTGTPYEVLTEEVFSRLHAQQRLCSNIERNIFLIGKSGARHQIDVTFTFDAGGVSYRTIVQCKDWGSPVKQGQVLEFKQVLDEIPGQPRGIMVSRSGFQEGARTLAAHHGIQLYELRAPRYEDWNGLLRTIELTVVLRMPTFENIHFRFDDLWVNARLTELGLKNLDVQLTISPEVDTLLFESGVECDLKHVLSPYVPKSACTKVSIHHEFEVALMLEVPKSPIQRLRATAVDADVSVTEKIQQVIRINADHLIAYCFRDVLGGAVQFLDANGAGVQVGKIISVDEGSVVLQ